MLCTRASKKFCHLAILGLHRGELENNNLRQSGFEMVKMSFSFLFIGAAVVIVVMVVACILFFVSRSDRD